MNLYTKTIFLFALVLFGSSLLFSQTFFSSGSPLLPPNPVVNPMFPLGDTTQSFPAVYLDDSRAKGTVVATEQDMYEEIRDWMQEGTNQRKSLLRMLERKFDTARVNEFMLQFMSGDSTYFLSPGTTVTMGQDPDCKCKYVTFTGEGDQGLILDVSPLLPKKLYEFEEGPTFFHPEYYHTQLWGFGAARGERNKLFKVGGHKDIERSVGSEPGDARAVFKIMYVCTNEDLLPSDCGCEKDLDLEWEYRGTLFARAQEGGFGNAEAHAQAEAGILVAEYSKVEGVQEITFPDDVELKRAFSSTENTWDPEFVSDAFDLAEAIVVGIVGDDIDNEDLISSTAGLIEALATGEAVDANSAANNMVPVISIGFSQPTISPGDEKAFILTSVTNHINEVSTGWGTYGISESGFGSAYRFHLTIPYDNSNPDCCIEKFGAWSYGGFNMSYDQDYGLGFNVNPNWGTFSSIRASLNSNFNNNGQGGVWDNFDINNFHGTTTSSAQDCGCNVNAGLELIKNSCDNVLIDISSTANANNYYLQITEVDANGNYVTGSWSGGWFSTLPNQIALNTPANPLGAYTFEAGKFYRIFLAVNGSCTAWTSTEVTFQAEEGSFATFSVLQSNCDNFVIDISGTSGATQYDLAIEEVTEQGVSIPGTSQSTGWVNSLPVPMDILDPVGPLGGYSVSGGKYYKVTLTLNDPCGGTNEHVDIVYIEPTTEAVFTLDPGCSEIIFDGTATENETWFQIVVEETNIAGLPLPNTAMTLTGAGSITTSYDLLTVPNFTFNPGSYYRVTLQVSNACSGIQESYVNFHHSVEPIPMLDGLAESCEEDPYTIYMGGAVAVEEIKIEVFESDQFGTAVGPVILFTDWVTYANQNPLVTISDPDNTNLPILFTGGTWYTVVLYGRNSCSTDEPDVFKVVYVAPKDKCLVQEPHNNKSCEAKFSVSPSADTTLTGFDVTFHDESLVHPVAATRTWDFGDGGAQLGANSTVHNYAQDGRYDVSLIVTDAYGCRDTVTKQVRIQGTAVQARREGAEDKLAPIQENSFISPNPADHIVNVSYEGVESGTFAIYTSTGQRLLEVALDPATNKQSVSVKQLAPGIYFGVLQDGNMRIGIQKMVIRH